MKIGVMFHCTYTLSDPSLLNMMTCPSVKKRRRNYSSSHVSEYITNIQIGDNSQAKEVFKYSTPRQMLGRKCKNKRDNLAKKRPGPIHVLGEALETDLVQLSLAINK